MLKKKKAEKKAESVAKPAAKTTAKPAAKKKGSGTSAEDAANPLGKKHTCYSCGSKFYDMHKEEVICPRCGADQNSKPALKQKAVKISKFSEFDVVDEEIGEPIDEEMIFDGEAEETIDEEAIIEEEEV